MKRTGIIHAGLARELAQLRHTDTFVISDAGLPVTPGIPCIDLGYRYGQPSFADVASALLAEVVVEASWVSADIKDANPTVLQHILGLGLTPERIDHTVFKERVQQVRFVVRTGEATMYANLLCQAGVAFG